MSEKDHNIYEDLYIKQVLKKAPLITKSNIFKNLCKEKISYDESTESVVEHRNFIEVIDKLNDKHPFLYIPELLEDHVNGVYNKIILKKFHLPDHDRYATVLSKNYLNLPKIRHKGSALSRKTNLTKTSFNNRYNQITNEINFFQEELLRLSNHNRFRALILLTFLDKNIPLTVEKIFLDIEETLQKNRDSFPLLNENKNVINSLEDYLKTNTKERIKDVLTELISLGFVNKTYDNEYEFTITYSEIKKSMLNILEKRIDGYSYSSSLKKIINEFPVLNFIPFFNFFDNMLNKLVNKGIIWIEMGYENYRPFSNVIYTAGNYKIPDKVYTQLDKGKKNFFGRKNEDSFQFVYELENLQKGDFDDADDQVTRIAGLILAESSMLISSPEELAEFDFAVDMSNYHLREEQYEAMKKSDFKMISKKIHMKVMINEEITEELIKKLHNILPKNEQGVIISFKDLSDAVRKRLPEDFSIQIIDKKGIQIWADITAILPCRIGSIVRIMDGDLIGNIASLKHVNYETGKAIINLIPSSDEANVYIGFLEEIDLLEDPQVDDHLLFSKNYFEFLNTVSDFSETDDLQTSIFKYPVIQKDLNLIELYDIDSSWSLDVDGNDVEVKLDNEKFLEIFKCSCNDWKEKKDSNKLCTHIILALNEIGLTKSFFSDSWGNVDQNIFYKKLTNFLKNTE